MTPLNRPPDRPHIPVLLAPVLDLLRVNELRAGRFVDGTVGAGGHAAAILEAAPDARLLGLDRDPAALALARERLAPFGERATLVHASYEDMPAQVAAWLGEGAQVDGILLDLGVSSMQLDQAERGFAFMQEAARHALRPDLGRADRRRPGQLLEADETADILYRYGEERHSRRIARRLSLTGHFTQRGS